MIELGRIQDYLRVRHENTRIFDASSVKMGFKPETFGDNVVDKLVFDSEEYIITVPAYKQITSKFKIPYGFLVANIDNERSRLWSLWVNSVDKKVRLKTETVNGVNYLTCMQSVKKNLPNPFEVYGLYPSDLKVKDSSWGSDPDSMRLDPLWDIQHPRYMIRACDSVDLKIEKESENFKGFSFDYSDVYGYMHLNRIIFRQICTNGLMGIDEKPFYEIKNFKHYEFNVDTFRAMISEVLKEFGFESDVLKFPLTPDRRKEFAELMFTSKLVRKFSAIRLAQQIKSREAELKTVYDMVNLITTYAKDEPTYVHRKNLETFAGSYIRRLAA